MKPGPKFGYKQSSEHIEKRAAPMRGGQDLVEHHNDLCHGTLKPDDKVVMTRAEHTRLHHTGFHHSEKSRRNMGLAQMGNKNSRGSRPSIRGDKNPMWGKKRPDLAARNRAKGRKVA